MLMLSSVEGRHTAVGDEEEIVHMVIKLPNQPSPNILHFMTIPLITHCICFVISLDSYSVRNGLRGDAWAEQNTVKL